MAFARLQSILDKIKRANPQLEKRLDEAEAVSRWEIAVGPAIARHARALRVQDGVLWVEVDHSIWKSELHHRKRQVLEKLNGTDLQSGAVKDLLLLDARRS